MSTPVDIDALLAVIGVISGRRSDTAPDPRTEPPVGAELLDEQPVKIDGEPLDVSAWLDGIQSSMALTYRHHRPIQLDYVAAGAVDNAGEPLQVAHQLTLACSAADRLWLDELPVHLPEVITTPATAPPEVMRDLVEDVGRRRAAMEQDLITALLAAHNGQLVVDGTISGHLPDPQLAGVVKTTGHRWLADEQVLYGLQSGWRSPRFIIPPAAAGHTERYSCYLRMVDAAAAPWDFGLIRLETFDPELLDPLAARVLAARQRRSSGDARWDRHIEPIAEVEAVLRALRPPVYQLQFT